MSGATDRIARATQRRHNSTSISPSTYLSIREDHATLDILIDVATAEVFDLSGASLWSLS